jgi:elongation factor G
MEKPAAPWPLLQIAIEPKSTADEQKLRAALSTLAEEQPDFEVKWNEEAGQTIIAAMTELDLDIIVHRLLTEFEVGFKVWAPQVACRETISRAREQDYTHKRIFAGQGQFARVKILFEPNGHNPDFVFVSRVPDSAFPSDYAAGVEKGVRTILVSGPYAGFPMIGIKATLVDAAYHDTDSSASAFEIAGRACFKEAAPKLGVQLLEPIMRVEVVTPQDYIRAIVGELKSRRAKFESQESRGTDVVVAALVPLANMFKLEDTLRSHSKGQARLTVSYAGYAALPHDDDDPPAAAMALARR